jgi:hypothetical protein
VDPIAKMLQVADRRVRKAVRHSFASGPKAAWLSTEGRDAAKQEQIISDTIERGRCQLHTYTHLEDEHVSCKGNRNHRIV